MLHIQRVHLPWDDRLVPFFLVLPTRILCAVWSVCVCVGISVSVCVCCFVPCAVLCTHVCMVCVADDMYGLCVFACFSFCMHCERAWRVLVCAHICFIVFFVLVLHVRYARVACTCSVRVTCLRLFCHIYTCDVCAYGVC